MRVHCAVAAACWLAAVQAISTSAFADADAVQQGPPSEELLSGRQEQTSSVQSRRRTFGNMGSMNFNINMANLKIPNNVMGGNSKPWTWTMLPTKPRTASTLGSTCVCGDLLPKHGNTPARTSKPTTGSGCTLKFDAGASPEAAKQWNAEKRALLRLHNRMDAACKVNVTKRSPAQKCDCTCSKHDWSKTKEYKSDERIANLEGYVGTNQFLPISEHMEDMCNALMKKVNTNKKICNTDFTIVPSRNVSGRPTGLKAHFNCSRYTGYTTITTVTKKQTRFLAGNRAGTTVTVRYANGTETVTQTGDAKGRRRLFKKIWHKTVGKLGAKLGIGGQRNTATTVTKTEIVWAKNTELLAVLDLCVSPCMADGTQTCCTVPRKISHKFSCCRKNKCCPDQRRRRRRAQSALGSGPRKGQVSVAVTVSVEESSSSVSVYDALLRCLQNPAKLDSMCLTGSSGH